MPRPDAPRSSQLGAARRPHVAPPPVLCPIPIPTAKSVRQAAGPRLAGPHSAAVAGERPTERPWPPAEVAPAVEVAADAAPVAVETAPRVVVEEGSLPGSASSTTRAPTALAGAASSRPGNRSSGLLVTFLGLIVGAAGVALALVDVPKESDAAKLQNNVYLWSDGKVMARGGEANRQNVNIGEIPVHDAERGDRGGERVVLVGLGRRPAWVSHVPCSTWPRAARPRAAPPSPSST